MFHGNKISLEEKNMQTNNAIIGSYLKLVERYCLDSRGVLIIVTKRKKKKSLICDRGQVSGAN